MRARADTPSPSCRRERKSGTVVDVTTPLYDALAGYARRLHAVPGDSHHVASPLGAWLLLALCAPAAGGATADELAAVLGLPAGDAAEAAAALLAHPHPLVSAATAVWHGHGRDTTAVRDWQAGLPPGTAVGELPEQAVVDAWVRQHTDGLIDALPSAVDPQAVLVLASALATRVSWTEPFQTAPAGALGPHSPWTADLTRVLRAPEAGHTAFVAATDSAGDVMVHIAEAGPRGPFPRHRLLVMSVAAAREVPATDVLAAAYELGRSLTDDTQTRRRSLFDLPLGDGPLWSLREEPVLTRGGREERYTVTLPCWSAGSSHDLTGPTLGFSEAARVVGRLLTSPGLGFDARQSAVARYGRYGFEAAAASSFMSVTSAPSQGVARTAELRFGHPYAVLAVAVDSRWEAGQGRVLGPWHGVPVFSAWVTRPEDLPEADAGDPPIER